MSCKVDIGVIGALDEEVSSLISKLSEKQCVTVGGIELNIGNLAGRRIAVARSGVGKVFAAMCAQAMIVTTSPSLIVNTGVGGALRGDFKTTDTAIAKRLVQHDMDTSAIGDPVGLISGINKVYFEADAAVAARLAECVKAEGANSLLGCIASGDQFICDGAKKAWIADTFSAVACEMEGAAIAHVATVNNTPFAVLRAISDEADGEASMDFPTFVRIAAARSVAVLCRFLRELA